MKKIIILLTALLSVFMSVSCEQHQSDIMTEREKEIAERSIAGTVGFGDDALICWFIDIHNINDVTKSASQIVLCRIEKLEKVSLSYRLAQLSFDYEVIIEDIYMDVNDMLIIGDRITVSSMKGIITGNEYKKLAASAYSRTRAFSHVHEYSSREYEENEYILSSLYDAIPFEVGRTYVMYLDDDLVEQNNYYLEAGYEFSYEYTDGVLYYGIDYKRMDIDLITLKEQILNDVKNRDK